MPPKKTVTAEGRIKKRPVEEDLDKLEEENKIEEEVETMEKKPMKSIDQYFNKTNKDEKADSLKKIKPDEPLPRDFYMCDVVELAEKLIGTYLIRYLDNGDVIKSMIVETEAYKAPLDKACHAYNNKKTDKTKWFWQEGGHLYMYSIYGNNNCMNIVSATAEEPEAVLIRAIEPIEGIAIMKQLRNNPKLKDKDLTNGPGKLTAAINIDKSYNGHDLTQKGNLILTKGIQPLKGEVSASKRINIDYAGEWIDKLWRFTLNGSRYVSK